MEEKVLIDDLETSEEDIFIDVTYKGLPFSGIAYDDTEDVHCEWSYLNGFGHGRGFSVYKKTGHLQEEFFLDKGQTIEETIWYENGIKREYYRKNPFSVQRWNADGVLLREANEEQDKKWYPSSKLKSVFIKKKEYTRYDESGEWLVKIKSEYEYVVLSEKEMSFNHVYIENHYMDLLQDHDFYKYFIIWLHRLERNKLAEAICNLIKSDILWHKYDGINLAKKYKIHEAIPYIKLELNNNEIPPSPDPNMGYGDTISGRARITLKEIENLSF